MSTRTQRAREFVEADLTEALDLLRDAAKLLPEAGLPDSPKLRAELDAAAKAAETAHATFRALLREESER